MLCSVAWYAFDAHVGTQVVLGVVLYCVGRCELVLVWFDIIGEVHDIWHIYVCALTFDFTFYVFARTYDLLHL